MKKTVLLSVLIPVVAVLLFLLKATGLTVHIALSVVGLGLLVAYTVATKKEWKTPVLEILMRAFYGIALVSGIAVKATELAALAILHKASAVLFVVLLIVLFVKKRAASKK